LPQQYLTFILNVHTGHIWPTGSPPLKRKQLENRSFS